MLHLRPVVSPDDARPPPPCRLRAFRWSASNALQRRQGLFTTEPGTRAAGGGEGVTQYRLSPIHAPNRRSLRRPFTPSPLPPFSVSGTRCAGTRLRGEK